VEIEGNLYLEMLRIERFLSKLSEYKERYDRTVKSLKTM